MIVYPQITQIIADKNTNLLLKLSGSELDKLNLILSGSWKTVNQ